jgi:hypothetical protein
MTSFQDSYQWILLGILLGLAIGLLLLRPLLLGPGEPMEILPPPIIGHFI